MPLSRRILGAVLLAGTLGLGPLGARFVARAPDAALLRARRSYRRFLEQHGARIVATDSAALQRTLSDCGIAVLREALRSARVGELLSPDSLARLARLTASGTTLTGLARAARLAGAQVLAHDRLQRVLGKHLTVAHLSLGHFVLVRASDNTHVRFFDPLVGDVDAPAALFEMLWSGGAFAVLNGGTDPPTASDTTPERDEVELQISARRP